MASSYGPLYGPLRAEETDVEDGVEGALALESRSVAEPTRRKRSWARWLLFASPVLLGLAAVAALRRDGMLRSSSWAAALLAEEEAPKKPPKSNAAPKTSGNEAHGTKAAPSTTRSSSKAAVHRKSDEPEVPPRPPSPPPRFICSGSRVYSNGQCICPPPFVPKGLEGPDWHTCVHPHGPVKMTFYMYRAEGEKESSPVENLDMANLPGIMFFLHHEVVGAGRKNHITRIVRYRITMQNTQALWDSWHSQFHRFQAFDRGSCGPRCEAVYREFGAVIGCQYQSYQSGYFYRPSFESMPLCREPGHAGCGHGAYGTWYSIPGACPHKRWAEKTETCVAEMASGACSVVNGARNCTFSLQRAGQVFLDELENIRDYKGFWQTQSQGGRWVPNGNTEYDKHLDRGVGMSFWDHRSDWDSCQRRMDAVLDLFQAKYPSLARELPEPPCTYS